MLKIISKKEYNKLKETERKYEELSGQCFTLYTGVRSKRGALLQMSKEELVRIIFDLNNKCIRQSKELINNVKDRRNIR